MLTGLYGLHVHLFLFVVFRRNKSARAIMFEEKHHDLLNSEDAEPLDDHDTLDKFKLDQCFRVKYKMPDEFAVSMKQTYILNMAHDNNFTRVAAGLSNGSVYILDINQQYGLSHTLATIPPIDLRAHAPQPVNICGVRFLDETPNCLLIGTTNGLVRLFDLRTQNEQARFIDKTTPSDSNKPPTPKEILCFDRNANGRVICAGTPQLKENVYLLFYDVRERRLLGGYFESHQDDVTSVQFHGQNPDLLCSGSIDGLINIYNIKEEEEDDALQITINTEESVQKLHWHKNVYNKDIISCVTHTNDYKSYETSEGDRIVSLDRRSITAGICRENPANCDLIDAHNMTDGSVFLLAGTNTRKGDVMRSIRLQNKEIQPLSDFEGNKQIVRESLYYPAYNALITGGEGGIVSLWSPKEESAAVTGDAGKLKAKNKSKSQKATPY